jgi:hypothetical protein
MAKKQHEIIVKGLQKLSTEALEERKAELVGEIDEAKAHLSLLYHEQVNIDQLIGRRTGVFNSSDKTEKNNFNESDFFNKLHDGSEEKA